MLELEKLIFCELSETDLVLVNGGEIPYSANSYQGGSSDAVINFCIGFYHGLMGR